MRWEVFRQKHEDARREQFFEDNQQKRNRPKNDNEDAYKDKCRRYLEVFHTNGLISGNHDPERRFGAQPQFATASSTHGCMLVIRQ